MYFEYINAETETKNTIITVGYYRRNRAMYRKYGLTLVFLLVNTTYQQNISPQRKREFCTAVQTNDLLEEALPLIRRHLEAETQSRRRQMDEVKDKLRNVHAELETAKREIRELKAYVLTSCSEILPGSPSGIYRVTLTPGRSYDVYCDMDLDSGPWTVIQNRQDCGEHFYRNWNEYKTGFGNLNGNFWAGLDIIHLLTQTGSILRIDLVSWSGDEKYAQYSNFSVGDESSKYTLSVSGFTGNVHYDAMAYHNGQPFSTYDSDNDNSGSNCAVDRHGAWWYGSCDRSNLNGPCVRNIASVGKAMVWDYFYSGEGAVSIMQSRMLVTRPAV